MTMNTKTSTSSATAIPSDHGAPDPAIERAIEQACARIAPSWPLDRFIAVNPLWSLTDRPLKEVSAELHALSSAQLLMPRAWFREALAKGLLRHEHLESAIARHDASITCAQLLELLERDAPAIPRRSKVTDMLDAERDSTGNLRWYEFVTNGISQYCAAYFDDGQALLGPNRTLGLYGSWRRQAQNDRAPALLMGFPEYSSVVRELPDTAGELLQRTLLDLEVPPAEHESYLTSLLLDVNGWASLCMYRRWTARLAGGDDHHIIDLLAIRAAWEWLLHRSGGGSLALRWQLARASWSKIDALSRTSRAQDWLFQEALEIAFQETIIAELPRGLDKRRPKEVRVQAVFCIDVRSEVFRRSLESQSASVQTLGFAGFFGLPVEYQAFGAEHARPQLPGLLPAQYRITDTGLNESTQAQRTFRLSLSKSWKSFKTGGPSTFAFVEAMGLPYAVRLLSDSLAKSPQLDVDTAGLNRDERALRKPRLTQLADGTALDRNTRCDLAAGILRGMSLTHDFAPLVFLVGHGSETKNNPHASGLDCGACCGQTGEVNARAAAALLNDPEVRAGLAERGISIEENTRFVAGLHNTTTDEIVMYDLDELPASHANASEELRVWLAHAGASARRERSASLGLSGLDEDALLASVRQRTRDWAEVRPEWGLANNAAFIVAPREHCRHLKLNGRSFLHEYRHEEDEGFAILELIMTAPMLVTHWINFQYYASTVDNLRYGSGNKVLHNVVGGHLGVFEGNTGDLRIGLPLQSLHDGNTWVHTPLRLSVFIEAPRAALESVLRKHQKVKNLATLGWLTLFQIDATEHAVHMYGAEGWMRQS